MLGDDNMKKTISIILIIAGILIASYPFLDRGYTWYMQQKVMKEWENTSLVEIDPSEEATEDFLAMQELLQQGDEDGVQEAAAEAPLDSPEVSPSTAPTKITTPPKAQQTLGVLKIDKINLNLPILDGATEKNLKIGSARVKGTSDIGVIGNVAIAAHRSHTFGRFFNRLAEIELGDEILITTDKETYKYRVYKIHVVEPTDVSVLYRNSKDKILTLITCDPPVKATHRLIIHAIQFQ